MPQYSLRALAIVLLFVSLIASGLASSAEQRRAPSAFPTPIATVVSLSVIKAESAARLLRRLYPRVRFVVDAEANALIVTASPDQITAIRSVCAGIDTKSALAPVTHSLTLHRLDSRTLKSRLETAFPQAHFGVVNARSLLVSADNATIQQIETAISSLDQPVTAPSAPPVVPTATEAVRVLQASPKDLAREVAGAVRGLRVQIAGQSVILTGVPDLLQRAKDIIAVLDVPPSGTAYIALYRLKNLDAQSVADLLQRSFANTKISVDEAINAITVLGKAADQRRIADGLAQLDVSPGSPSGGTAAAATVGGNGSVQVYSLKYALPGQGGASSTSATELSTMVSQTLASQAPDLHVGATPNNAQLILTGSPYSIKLARELLNQLDVPQRLVVLDTEILEVDENTAKHLGLQMSNIVGGAFSFGTVFSEVQPTPDPTTGVAPPLTTLRPLTRTAFGFAAALNLAIQHGAARVLADPRITTLSGHTATIRAGDNIAIQLQAGGGPGTIATTQIQTFQTGVSLDITPIVNDEGLITVSLHPVVNSLTGILNNIPQISTRDTQTTVALRENETLVIGGLIQDNTQRTESRIPILGDLPLVGRAFRDQTLNGNRNELIISVTPHILTPGQPFAYPGPALPVPATPQPLPTLPAGTLFPSSSSNAEQSPTSGPTIVTPTPSIELPKISQGSAAGASINNPGEASGGVASNTFIYGAIPMGNLTSQTDSAEIYYVMVSPTQVSYGAPIAVTAVTSTSVATVTLSFNGVSVSIPQQSPGKWYGTLPFTFGGNMPASDRAITPTITATRADGNRKTLQVPMTLLPASSPSSKK